ncbi:hypothetical protein LAZ67_9003622 [Cordylochernes scorpioides]|uniref:Maturase K n=1 Tax=Cordylochernes scorpioides TaxID=51811 RepID=A0ABY6KXY2_9ARAC|nr:hypothetical protein LAZ67_9003622 [Cordylochernes scorpioides]
MFVYNKHKYNLPIRNESEVLLFTAMSYWEQLLLFPYDESEEDSIQKEEELALKLELFDNSAGFLSDKDTLDSSIFARIIIRRLVASGLHSLYPLRRLPLTQLYRHLYLQFCWNRATWTVEWYRVVFLDESTFS